MKNIMEIGGFNGIAISSFSQLQSQLQVYQMLECGFMIPRKKMLSSLYESKLN